MRHSHRKGMFRAMVPSGASTGIYEAVELRDGGNAWMGKGCTTAVKNINEIIAPALVGKDPREQKAPQCIPCAKSWTVPITKGSWGRMLFWRSLRRWQRLVREKRVFLCTSTSLSWRVTTSWFCRCHALNIINGGSHAGNKLAMQEFMILPVGAKSFAEAMQMGSEVYHNLKSVIKKKYGQDACNVGDEGGFAPNIQDNKEGLDLVVEAIEKAGYTGKVKIGMDVAASEFLTKDGMYDLDFKTENNDGSMKKTGKEMIDLYNEFCTQYPMVSIEDPFDQDDAENTALLTAGGKCQIVGDDLLVTNPKRVQQAIDGKWCNALC